MDARGNTPQNEANISKGNSSFPQKIVDWQDCELLQDEPRVKKLPKPSSSEYANVYRTVKPKSKTKQRGRNGPSPKGKQANQKQEKNPSTLRERPPWDNYLRSPSNKRYPREVSKPSKDEICKRKRWKQQMEEAEEKRRQICREQLRGAEPKKAGPNQHARAARRENIQSRYERKLRSWEKSARDRQRADKEFWKLKNTVKRTRLLHDRLHEEFEQSASDAESERQQLYNQSLHRMRMLRPCDIIESNALEQIRKEVGNIYSYGTRSRSDPVRRKPAKHVSQSPERSSLAEQPKPRLVHRAVSPIDWEAVENMPLEEDQLLDRISVQNEEAERVNGAAQEVNAEEDLAL